MVISPLALVLGPIAVAPFLTTLALADNRESSSSVVPTKNYIDTVSGYHDLSTCAEDVLSTIVRGQFSGCGDNNAVTSHTCFCTDSSSFFSAEITSAVSATCDPSVASAQASSAVRVFDAYCALGVEAGLARTTAASAADATGTAAPAATALSTAATATSTPPGGATTGGSSSNSNGVNSAVVAAAVVVPVCLIGLGLMWCLLWRRRRRQTRGDRAEKQRELEAMPVPREAPPRRVEANRATTEFRWPARIGDRTTQLQQAQEAPEKELFVSSPTATSFQGPGAPLPAYHNPEYHISPQPYTYQDRQHHELHKHEYPSQGLHQTEPAELPHHDVPELFSRQPQELPGQTPPPMFPQELEGTMSPDTLRAPRSRFSYQT